MSIPAVRRGDSVPKHSIQSNIFSWSRMFGGGAGSGHFGGISQDIRLSNAQYLNRSIADEEAATAEGEEEQRQQQQRQEVEEQEANPELCWKGEEQEKKIHTEKEKTDKHKDKDKDQEEQKVDGVFPSQAPPVHAASPLSLPSVRPLPKLRLPRLPAPLSGSFPALHLSQIPNPKIRAMLDPNDESVRPQDLDNWSEQELDELVDSVEPVHLTGFIKKSVEWLTTERCKSLIWKDVTVRNEQGQFAVRKSSGFLMPGMTCAVLAAPDAGVTTLFNALTRRQETGEVTGEILYDGRPLDPSYQRHLGYVLKDDLQFSVLTVMETFMFSAQVRTPPCPTKVNRFKVKLCMKLLGLSHAADTFIGDASIKGVSGGERRRVSYGVEMVAGHSAIIADLPTNGLDSASAYALIKTIRYINRSGGRSLLCSVVQPSPSLYHLFDHVMLLTKGQTIYFGPTKNCLSFILAAGFVRPQNKSEPQFLEELTAKPEVFYRTSIHQQQQIQENTQQPLTEEENNSNKTKTQNNHKSEQKQLEQEAPTQPLPKPQHREIKQSSPSPAAAADVDNGNRKEEIEMSAVSPPNGEITAQKATRIEEQCPSTDETKKEADSLESTVGSPTDQKQVHSMAQNNRVATEEEVKVEEFDIDGDKIIGTPARVHAWKLLKERYEKSLFHERVEVVIAKEQERGRTEQRMIREREQQGHNDCTPPSTQQAASHSYSSPPVSAPPPFSLCRGLSKFTGSMSVVDLGRSVTQIELEERLGPGGGKHKFNRSVLQQTKQTIHRQMLLTYRTPGLWFGSWVKASLMAIIAGTLFLNLPTTTDYGRTRLGLFFFVGIYIGVGAVEILAFLMQSRGIYYQQNKAGYYRGISYYIAFLLSQFPLSIIETWFFSITVYGFAGLRDNVGSDHFWFFFLVIFSTNMTSRCWVFVVSTVAPNAILAFVMIPITNVLFVQFAGFLQPRNAIPIGWRWMNYCSPYTWAWRALSVNELYGITLTPGQIAATASLTSGTAVLQEYSIDDDMQDRFFDELWLSLFFAGFVCLGILAILTIDWSRPDTPQAPDFGAGEAQRKKKAAENKQQNTQQKQQQTQSQPAEKAPATSDIAVSVSTDPSGSLGRRGDAYFQWRNLDYSVRLSNGTERMLLKQCYGYARPGLMVALMGASGAGKSTLLDVLAGKKTAGKQKGEILLNGKPFDSRAFNHAAGYVEQFDSHNPFSTVREAIIFSARLRLPTVITSQPGEVESRVEHVMSVLDLHHAANSIIGSPGFGGVSPEVRKKVTIAVELIFDPSLLFLDEPTTGLDSNGAYDVMTAVKKLAKSIAVVCTIHQPSNEIVHMFDWLLLLQPGGMVVYFGPVNELVDYFVEAKIAPRPDDPDSPDLNVADFALDAIRNSNTRQAQGEGEGVDMVEAFKQSQRHQEIERELDVVRSHREEQQTEEEQNTQNKQERNTIDPHTKTENGQQQQQPPVSQPDNPPAEHKQQKTATAPSGVRPLSLSKSQRRQSSILVTEDGREIDLEADKNYAGFFTQLALLTVRQVRNTWRSGLTIKTRYFNVLVVGLITGSSYFRLDYSQDAASTRVSVLFTAIIIPMFLSSSALAEVFVVRPVYFREYTSRMYGALPWFLARRLADVPYYMVEVTVFGTLLYWMANMRSDNDGGYFFWFLFTLMGIRAAGSAFTQGVATIFASPEVASAFQSTGFVIFFLFAGFLIPRPNIANGWIWMYYLSFIRYPLDFLLANELADKPFTCGNDVPSSGCPITNGNQVLDEFGVATSLTQGAIEFIALWIFLIGFLTIGFWALKFINHIKR